MKRLFTILLFLIAMNGFSQNWAPFPLDETSEWREYASRKYTDFCAEHDYTVYWLEDTVSQNGHLYYEIGYHLRTWRTTFFYPEPQPGCDTPTQSYFGTAGLYRSEEGKMYRATETGEELFLDFSGGVGDTVMGIPLLTVVESVDSVEIGNNMCKRLWVSVLGNPSNPAWMIEGVGHQHGFRAPITLFENDGALCYLEDEVPLVSYEFNGYAPCLIALQDESLNDVRVEITPNPSSGIFNFVLQQQFSYQVFDLFGKLVQEGNGSGQSAIDISSKPDGIYLLRVDSDKGSLTQKLVKQ